MERGTKGGEVLLSENVIILANSPLVDDNIHKEHRFNPLTRSIHLTR
jgi:hypothetical protein